MRLHDEATIVFAGDSVTDADKNSCWDKMGNGYVRLMQDALAAFYPQKRFRVINAGVSGDNSRDLLARWDRDVAAFSPDVLFCLIGINDVWRHFDKKDPEKPLVSEEEFAKNIKMICERGKIYKDFTLMTPYFIERNQSDEMLQMTLRYARIARETAHACGVRVLDLQPEFDEYMKTSSGLSISWDRVHPGNIGSLLIARAILRSLEKHG